MTEGATVSVLITFYNTVFDWFEPWHASFTAMMETVARISSIPLETLYLEAKTVHQRHGTSEYAFLLEELPSIRKAHSISDIPAVYSEAIDAFRAKRRETLKLYPGVMDTFVKLREIGTYIVAYTESMGFYSADRLRRLQLDGIVDILYTQEDHDLPDGIDLSSIRTRPAEAYDLKGTLRRFTPRGEVKPNPDILRYIVREVGAQPDACIYVGDSLHKDVLMAQRARVRDVFAKYGPAHIANEHPERYDLLRQVTHWTEAQVEEERRIREIDVRPTFVLEETFDEVLSIFQFIAHKPISQL